jgi:hypothetical protein
MDNCELPPIVEIPDGAIARIMGHGTFETEVFGEAYYQEHLGKICGPRTKECVNIQIEAVLVLENQNEFDPMAVAVMIRREPVGHLRRDDARRFRDVISRTGFRNCRRFQVTALIRGGWDRGNGDLGFYGVRIDIPASVLADGEQDEPENQ